MAHILKDSSRPNINKGRKLIINSFCLSNFSSVCILHISNTKLPHPPLFLSQHVFFWVTWQSSRVSSKLNIVLQRPGRCPVEVGPFTQEFPCKFLMRQIQCRPKARFKSKKHSNEVTQNQCGQTHQPCWVKSLFEDEWTDLFKVMYLRLKLEERKRREEFHQYIFIFHLGFLLCLLPSPCLLSDSLPTCSPTSSPLLSSPLLSSPLLSSLLNQDYCYTQNWIPSRLWGSSSGAHDDGICQSRSVLTHTGVVTRSVCTIAIWRCY